MQSDSGDRSRGGESEESAMRDDVVGEISLELKRGRGQGPSPLILPWKQQQQQQQQQQEQVVDTNIN